MVFYISNVNFGEYVFNHHVLKNPTDPSNHFTSHVHNEYEMIMFISGDATYVIEDRKYKLRPYDVILIPPSKYHYIQIDGDDDYERFDLLFPTRVIGEALLNKLPSDIEVISCAESRTVKGIFSRMDRYTEFGEEVISDLLPGLVKEVLYNLSRTFEERISKPENMSPLISRALDYINSNLYIIKDIEEVSAALFVAPTYFFRIFKEQMKISPKKYITIKRLIAAEKRIREGEKPTDIYTECGFATYTAFYKRYIDYFGTPPSKTK